MPMTLKKRIESYGIGKLARESGLTDGMISYVKDGKRTLSKENAEIVADILGIDIEEVLPRRCNGCKFLPSNQ